MVFTLGLGILGFFKCRHTLPLDVEKEGMAMMTKGASLDAAGLAQLSTWQLCNIQNDAWQRWRVRSFDPAYAKCYRNGYLSGKERFEILEYAPGIRPILEMDDREDSEFWIDPISARVKQHCRLARLAVVEFQSRFPIGTTALPSTRNVCVGLPQFNTAIADIMAWYDLFDDWSRILNAMVSSHHPVSVEQQRHLQSIQPHLHRVKDRIERILETRKSERFKELVAAYEDRWCTGSKIHLAGPSYSQDRFSVRTVTVAVFYTLLLLLPLRPLLDRLHHVWGGMYVFWVFLCMICY